MPVQTGLCIAASCHCICMGRICPGLIYLWHLIHIRQSSQSLEVSGAVTGSPSRFCYVMSKWWPEEAAPEQGGKGCSLPGWRELCCGEQAQGVSLGLPSHRHVGNPNTSTCWQVIVLYFPQCFSSLSLPRQTLPCVLWSSPRFDREGLVSALPWIGGHTHQWLAAILTAPYPCRRVASLASGVVISCASSLMCCNIM